MEPEKTERKHLVESLARLAKAAYEQGYKHGLAAREQETKP